MIEIAKNFNFVNNSDYVFNKFIEKFDKNCFIFFYLIFFCFSYEKLKTSKQTKKSNVKINMNNKLFESCEKKFDKNDRDKNQCKCLLFLNFIHFFRFTIIFNAIFTMFVFHRRLSSIFFYFLYENSFFFIKRRCYIVIENSSFSTFFLVSRVASISFVSSISHDLSSTFVIFQRSSRFFFNHFSFVAMINVNVLKILTKCW